MKSSIKPGFYDESWPDDFIEVSTEDAYAAARRLAREEGIYAGVSSAANVLAAQKIAAGLSPEAVVVTVLCDTGSRYVSDLFWSPEGGDGNLPGGRP